MLYRRGRIWWVEIYHGDRRIRRSTRLASRAAAERWHDEFKARLWQEKVIGKCLSQAFVLWLQARPRSRNDKNAVKLIRRLYVDRPLIDITPASVESIFGSKGPSTYNRLVSTIRASLNLAKKRGWMETVPEFPKRVEPRGRIRFLTADEWRRLASELPWHLRKMAEFTLATGLRWSNVARLQWSQISIVNRCAWIHPDQSKNSEPLSVPLAPSALRCLREVSDDNGRYVFVYRNQPITSGKTAWLKACERAQLSELRWHDLRHTWASWHVMNGTPLEVLQKLGGWKTREMVERYAHLAPNYVARFAANARPVAHSTPHSRGKVRASGRS